MLAFNARRLASRTSSESGAERAGAPQRTGERSEQRDAGLAGGASTATRRGRVSKLAAKQ